MTANLRVREIECGRAISMAATGPLGAIGSAVLLLLTATAVAIGIVQSPLTASDLKEELLTPAELGGGWTMLFPIKEYNLKDTWASPSCYKWTTSFGGPGVNFHLYDKHRHIASVLGIDRAHYGTASVHLQHGGALWQPTRA